MRAILTTAFAAALLSAASAAAEPRALDLGALRPGAAVMRAIAACAPDAERLCAEVAPGGGRIAACLSERRDALDPPCAEEVAKADLLRDAVGQCAPDIAAYCGAAPPGGGRILACLAGNQDRLEDACFDGLSRVVETYGG